MDDSNKNWGYFNILFLIIICYTNIYVFKYIVYQKCTRITKACSQEETKKILLHTYVQLLDINLFSLNKV